MKKIYCLVGLLGLLSFGQTNPNDLPEIAPKSPEAAAFLKYGEYPINLSTGVPNISIPLYTIDLGTFKLPITLDYHASGIKVDQEATWVGLGWNLNYGAQIILSVRDDIDENNPYIDSFVPDNQTILDYFNQHPYAFTQNQFIMDYKLDWSRVKDVYNFSSPTTSGNFYIRSRQNNDVVVFPPDAFKVDISGGQPGNTFEFKVTDKEGNEYYFRNTKEITSRSLTHSDYYTSAWFVDDIKTNSNETISFVYQDDGAINEHSLSQRLDIKEIGENLPNCLASSSIYNTISSSPISISSTTTTLAKKIKEILFHNGNSKVLFDKIDGREDLLNANGYLNKIEVQKYENSTFYTTKGFGFDYSYFDTTDAVSNFVYDKKRLKLDQVYDFISGDIIASFVYSDLELPNKRSFSQDYFGYFNDKTNLNLIPKHFLTSPYDIEVGQANKSVNPSVNQAGILKEIHYPTKGYTKFNYESNDYFGVDEFNQYQLNIVNGNLVQGSGPGSSPPDEMPYIDYFILDPNYNPCTRPNPSNCVQFALFPYQAINATGHLVFQINNTAGSDPTLIKYQYARVSLYDGNQNLIYTSNKTHNAGTYTIPVSLPDSGVIFVEAYGQNLSVSNLQLRYVNNDQTPKNLLAGGLRIKSLENYNFDDNTLSLKEYTYKEPDDLLKSSGHLVNDLVVDFKSKPFSNYSLNSCQGGGQGAPLDSDLDYSKIYSISSNSKYGIEGNSIIYQYVKEEIKDIDNNEDKGITWNEFTIGTDEIPFGNSTVQIYTTWKRGKLLERKEYHKNGNLLRKETNDYFEDQSKISYIEGFKMFTNSTLNVVEDSSDPTQPPYLYSLVQYNYGIPSNTLMMYEPVKYSFPIYWYYLKNTTITEYFYDSNNALTGTLEKNIDYTYGNTVHLQLTNQNITTSTGDIVETIYSYAPEMGNQAMIDKNMVGIPLKTETFRGTEPLSTVKTTYKDWGNSLLAPELVETAKGTEALETRVRYNVMDNTNGNPLEVQKEGGMLISYIWGYNSTQPVAKIENLAYGSIPVSLITAIQSATDAAVYNEQNVLSALDALRTDPALANAMVTTYTYKPLVGVSTITDPKGNKVSYYYDSFGRLQYVKDKDGNILSENEYHYKN